MKKLIVGLTLLASMTSFANQIEPININKFTGSINQEFFDRCVDNLTDYDRGTKICKIFQAPEGNMILKDNGYIGSLGYLARWSVNACKLQGGDIGQIYLKQTDTEVSFIMENVECLHVMNEKIKALNFPWKDKSIYLKIR